MGYCGVRGNYVAKHTKRSTTHASKVAVPPFTVNATFVRIHNAAVAAIRILSEKRSRGPSFRFWPELAFADAKRQKSHIPQVKKEWISCTCLGECSGRFENMTCLRVSRVYFACWERTVTQLLNFDRTTRYGPKNVAVGIVSVHRRIDGEAQVSYPNLS